MVLLHIGSQTPHDVFEQSLTQRKYSSIFRGRAGQRAADFLGLAQQTATHRWPRSAMYERSAALPVYGMKKSCDVRAVLSVVKI